MIATGLYPLVGGLASTSLLIAYSDIRHGWFNPLYLGPGVGGISLFVALTQEWPLMALGAMTAVLMVGGTWLTLKAVPWITLHIFHRTQDSSQVAKGDYIVLALFSLWPEMVVYAGTLAVVWGIAGFRFGWWNRGLRTIPLAGLMGVFCVLYILRLAVA